MRGATEWTAEREVRREKMASPSVKVRARSLDFNFLWLFLASCDWDEGKGRRVGN